MKITIAWLQRREVRGTLFPSYLHCPARDEVRVPILSARGDPMDVVTVHTLSTWRDPVRQRLSTDDVHISQ